MAYDVMSACQTLFHGLVIEQPLLHAATTCWKAKGAALDSSDITTILAAANALDDSAALAPYVPTTIPDYPTPTTANPTGLPTHPTGLPRFPDGSGGMETPDGWNITAPGQVVK